MHVCVCVCVCVWWCCVVCVCVSPPEPLRQRQKLGHTLGSKWQWALLPRSNHGNWVVNPGRVFSSVRVWPRNPFPVNMSEAEGRQPAAPSRSPESPAGATGLNVPLLKIPKIKGRDNP